MPCLTELGVLNITQTGLVSDPFLLSPTLRHLSVKLRNSHYSDVPDDGIAFTTSLQHIATAIPLLSSLNIDRGPGAGVSWTMPSFTALRNLDITLQLMVDTSILTVIGQFQHLRTLSASITIGDCAHLRGCLQSVTTGCRVRSGRLTRTSRGIDEHLCNESGARLDSQAGDKMY